MLLLVHVAQQPTDAVCPARCLKPEPAPVEVHELAVPFLVKSYNFHNTTFLVAFRREIIHIFQEIYNLLSFVPVAPYHQIVFSVIAAQETLAT